LHLDFESFGFFDGEGLFQCERSFRPGRMIF
ncbi:MAG: hypothetical protein ACI805_002810, partial [Candidatus Azotimanducaceae bacterium]